MDDEELPGAASSLQPEEEMPRVRLTRRQVVAFGIFVLSTVAFLYFVLPKLHERRHDLSIASSAATPGGSWSGWCSRSCPSVVTSCCFARFRQRAEPNRLAGEL